MMSASYETLDINSPNELFSAQHWSKCGQNFKNTKGFGLSRQFPVTEVFGLRRRKGATLNARLGFHLGIGSGSTVGSVGSSVSSFSFSSSPGGAGGGGEGGVGGAGSELISLRHWEKSCFWMRKMLTQESEWEERETETIVPLSEQETWSHLTRFPPSLDVKHFSSTKPIRSTWTNQNATTLKVIEDGR